MAEMTRPGSLAKVRPVDSASELTAPHGAQVSGDLGGEFSHRHLAVLTASV
jgi:hypothetical protein